MTTLDDLPPIQQVRHCPVGTRIWFAEEKTPYRVRARSARYLVCTRPFNPKRTTLYTVVDLEEQVRGPENLVFGMGAETAEDCAAMVERLHGITREPSPGEQAQIKELPRALRKACRACYEGPTEVSHRHRVELNVVRVGLSQ